MAGVCGETGVPGHRNFKGRQTPPPNIPQHPQNGAKSSRPSSPHRSLWVACQVKLYQQGLVPFAQSEALGQSIRVVGACAAELLYSKGTVWEPLTAFKGLSETFAPVGPVSSKSPQHPHMASATVRDHEL